MEDSETESLWNLPLAGRQHLEETGRGWAVGASKAGAEPEKDVSATQNWAGGWGHSGGEAAGDRAEGSAVGPQSGVP